MFICKLCIVLNSSRNNVGALGYYHIILMLRNKVVCALVYMSDE
jgi:hypothetical protein